MTDMSEKISCKICGAEVHTIQLHLKNHHPEVTLEEYQRKYPGAPLLSQFAEMKLQERRAAAGEDKSSVMEMAGGAAATVVSMADHAAALVQPLHEVFGLGKVKAALNARGNPIPIKLNVPAAGFEDLIPGINVGYVWNIDLLKTVLMGLDMNVPIYLWGHAGTGKTTILEQISARTKRPFLRVQHTVNTEESHIVGMWTVKDGHTQFELGPLAVAMKFGLTYCADEYDFATPAVLSVYQPVLEGKALVIKEADHANRVIKPHPNFRFVATGNTNGSGDETGLYQGTVLQNAANYERFGIVEEVTYMKRDDEVLVITSQADDCSKEHAGKLVDFATEIRKQYAAGKISAPISPRALIYAARIGLRKADMKVGLKQSFLNRLPRADAETGWQFAQRIFG